MLKKTIKYEDYNGVEREEDFYFNLTKAEVAEMELSEDGGLAEKIQKVVNETDGREIMRIFKTVILTAYGEKDPSGKRFIKSEEISTAFSQTEAYSELVVELMTKDDAAAKFFNGILPDTPLVPPTQG